MEQNNYPYEGLCRKHFVCVRVDMYKAAEAAVVGAGAKTKALALTAFTSSIVNVGTRGVETRDSEKPDWDSNVMSVDWQQMLL